MLGRRAFAVYFADYAAGDGALGIWNADCRLQDFEGKLRSIRVEKF